MSRRKTALISILATALVCAACAAAAWIVYTGLSGTGGSEIGTPSQTLGAIEVAFDTPYFTGSDTPLSPGQSGSLVLVAQNDDPNDGETISSVSVGSITSSVNGCASHITANTSTIQSALVGQTIPKGASFGNGSDVIHVPAALSADASLPASCAGATVNVALTGATAPA